MPLVPYRLLGLSTPDGTGSRCHNAVAGARLVATLLFENPRFSTLAPLTALLHRKLPFSDTFPVLPRNTNKARLRGHLFNSCFTRRMGLAPDFKLAYRFTTPNIEFVASKCTPC